MWEEVCNEDFATEFDPKFNTIGPDERTDYNFYAMFFSEGLFTQKLK
jgi:hypothetical protein